MIGITSLTALSNTGYDLQEVFANDLFTEMNK